MKDPGTVVARCLFFVEPVALGNGPRYPFPQWVLGYPYDAPLVDFAAGSDADPRVFEGHRWPASALTETRGDVEFSVDHYGPYTQRPRPVRTDFQFDNLFYFSPVRVDTDRALKGSAGYGAKRSFEDIAAEGS